MTEARKFCYFCSKPLIDLPFKCKYCSMEFCVEHRLPESHECSGLKQIKEKVQSGEYKWFREKQVKKPNAIEKLKAGKTELYMKIATLAVIVIVILWWLLS